jgi:hypothetical protein
MATMNLELGLPEVFPELPKSFSPKPPAPPLLNRVAILIVHGMGQQVPYETIDGVAQAAARGVEGGGGTVSRSVIRSVRLGTQGKDDEETELVRAEMQVKENSGQERDVHIYEAYWAPLTEGKVSLTEVINFLFDAGWNGIENTEARTYGRWMFGEEQQFVLPTEKLIATLCGAMALLVALILVNLVAASTFGLNSAVEKVASLAQANQDVLHSAWTWDIVLVEIAELSVAAGIFVFGRSKLKIARFISWGLVLGGALLIIIGAILMVVHLAVPGFLSIPSSWSHAMSRGWTLRLIVLATEVWVVYTGRDVLVQYVGDVAAYIAAHTVSRFWEVRQQIWRAAMKVGEAVYRARTADNTEFLYTKIIVVGHSLGSVIAYDVLNGLLLDEQFSAQPLNVADRTRMFLTFGSPLDKTAFLFRTQKDMRSQVREVGAAAVQPMITNYGNRPHEWVNLWSPSDIISGRLDFYDPPTTMNAKHPEHYLHARPNPKQVQNYIDPEAKTPLKAHIEY